MMLLKNGNNTTSKLSFALSAALMISVANPAFAGVSTRDSGANSKLSDISATTNEVLTEQTEQTKALDDISSAVGEAGPGGSPVSLPAFKQIGSESEFYQNMEKFGFDMCAINLCQVGNNPADTKDIDEAREWATSTFFSSTPLSGAEKRDLTEVRRRAVAYTASNALAISTTVHNDLAAGGGSAQALEDMVNGAGDFRKDIQTNSAIALAQYKVAIQQLAVLSAILDVQATQAILTSSLYHEDGGSEFPDAYIDSDYDSNNVGSRHTVTTPQKGSPN